MLTTSLAHYRRLLPFQLLLAGTLLQCVACGQEQRTEQSFKSPQTPRALPTPVRTAGEDWPVFLGPHGDGASSETGIDPKLWQPIPPVVWSIPLGVSYGAPTIAAGKLFQFDRYGDYERLTCYAAESGQELWQSQSEVIYDDRYGYNNGPRCSPLVDGKLVYLYGVTGNLSCVDADNGQVVWSNDLNTDYGVVPNFFGVASNPCVF
ncbi:MAG: PQQ-binding-like beta-propeller repeat protein, partial [Aureliella sp.]